MKECQFIQPGNHVLLTQGGSSEMGREASHEEDQEKRPILSATQRMWSSTGILGNLIASILCQISVILAEIGVGSFQEPFWINPVVQPESVLTSIPNGMNNVRLCNIPHSKDRFPSPRIITFLFDIPELFS